MMASAGRFFTSWPLRTMSCKSRRLITLLIKIKLTFPRVVEHFVHERGVDRVNRRIHVKRLRGLAAFLVTDHIAHAAADVVINDEARIRAHACRSVESARRLFAAERADDEETSALEQIHRLAQRDATDDGSQFQILTPGSDSSTRPTTSQRTGLLSTPTALRAAIPSDEIITCWCMPAPCESIAMVGEPSASPFAPMGWQITRRQPARLGCFRVATIFPSMRASSMAQ